MWYVFDNKGACISSCDSEPNIADLAARGETAIENAVHYSIRQIHIVDGKIKEKPPAPAPTVPSTPVIDDVRLAAFEAMAAQEERMAEQAKRIAELETMVKALKGGEGK